MSYEEFDPFYDVCNNSFDECCITFDDITPAPLPVIAPEKKSVKAASSVNSQQKTALPPSPLPSTSEEPTAKSSAQPSVQPSAQPSAQPSDQPSVQSLNNGGKAVETPKPLNTAVKMAEVPSQRKNRHEMIVVPMLYVEADAREKNTAKNTPNEEVVTTNFNTDELREKILNEVSQHERILNMCMDEALKKYGFQMRDDANKMKTYLMEVHDSLLAKEFDEETEDTSQTTRMTPSKYEIEKIVKRNERIYTDALKRNVEVALEELSNINDQILQHSDRDVLRVIRTGGYKSSFFTALEDIILKLANTDLLNYEDQARDNINEITSMLPESNNNTNMKSKNRKAMLRKERKLKQIFLENLVDYYNRQQNLHQSLIDNINVCISKEFERMYFYINECFQNANLQASPNKNTNQSTQ